VACANAVKYCHAQPVFLDSELATGGLCTKDLAFFLDKQTEKKANGLYNKTSGKRIAACIPMHAFGLPMDIHKTIELCDHFGIPVIEDAAESLGSFTAGKHTGSLAKYGALSFNGNKIITCGGGGMCLFQNEQDAKLAKHLTTTAKVPHRWECRHDQIGYNYRMPNINAAIAKAQFKYLDVALKSKRETAEFYRTFFEKRGYQILQEQKDTTSNYWLNTVVLKDKAERDKFLAFTNDSGVMTRPLWELMSELTPYKNCQHSKLENARWLQERAVNIPSGVRYNITPE
jgi:dTDP-4-amino-4,6-dideoxygalactose transaminase